MSNFRSLAQSYEKKPVGQREANVHKKSVRNRVNEGGALCLEILGRGYRNWHFFVSFSGRL